jgi:hypothetical protein
MRLNQLLVTKKLDRHETLLLNAVYDSVRSVSVLYRLLMWLISYWATVQDPDGFLDMLPTFQSKLLMPRSYIQSPSPTSPDLVKSSDSTGPGKVASRTAGDAPQGATWSLSWKGPIHHQSSHVLTLSGI